MQRWWSYAAVLALVIVVNLPSAASAEVLTLEQCIKIALEEESSTQLVGARLSYTQSRQGVWSAWGDLLPSLTHGFDYSHTKYSEVTYDPDFGQFVSRDSLGLPKHSTSWSNGFRMSQTLFDGGANWYRVAQAYHNRASAREGVRGAENALVLGVKEKYFALLKARKLVEVQQAAVRRAEEFLKTIQSRYELGSASLSEVLKAKVELGTAQLELLTRENDVQTSRADLNTVLKRPVDSDLDVAELSGEETPVPTYDEAMQTALRNSPDLIGAQASYRAAKDEIGVARATFFPTLSWSASRSFNPLEAGDLLDYDGRFGTWFIGGSLNFTLFSGFHRKTAISNARASVKYARETLDQTERTVAFSVKQAYLGVDLAAETRNLADQIEVSAQEDFNLAQEKYNLGAATILDLLDAQVSLTRAQNDKVNAMFDYHVAVARLENAIGQGVPE